MHSQNVVVHLSWGWHRNSDSNTTLTSGYEQNEYSWLCLVTLGVSWTHGMNWQQYSATQLPSEGGSTSWMLWLKHRGQIGPPTSHSWSTPSNIQKARPGWYWWAPTKGIPKVVDERKQNSHFSLYEHPIRSNLSCSSIIAYYTCTPRTFSHGKIALNHTIPMVVVLLDLISVCLRVLTIMIIIFQTILQYVVYVFSKL